MKKIFFAAAFLLTACFCFSEPAGKVTLVGGEGILVCEGENLNAGSVIHFDAAISTGIKSYAKIRLDFGDQSETEIYLSKGTTVKIRRKIGDRRGVNLILGRLWSLFSRKGAKIGYAVETYNSVAGVEGTEFVVDCDQKRTNLWVLSGMVRHHPKRKMPPGIPFRLMDGQLIEAGFGDVIDEHGRQKEKKKHHFTRSSFIASADVRSMPEKVPAKPAQTDVRQPETAVNVEPPDSPDKPQSTRAKPEYKIIGDIDGDGNVGNFDTGLLNAYLGKQKQLSSLQLKAADVNGDGVVDSGDLNVMNLYDDGLGDVNHDKRFDDTDLELLKEAVNAKKSESVFDINSDGKVDERDVSVLIMILKQFENSVIGSPMSP